MRKTLSIATNTGKQRMPKTAANSLFDQLISRSFKKLAFNSCDINTLKRENAINIAREYLENEPWLLNLHIYFYDETSRRFDRNLQDKDRFLSQFCAGNDSFQYFRGRAFLKIRLKEKAEQHIFCVDIKGKSVSTYKKVLLHVASEIEMVMNSIATRQSLEMATERANIIIGLQNRILGSHAEAKRVSEPNMMSTIIGTFPLLFGRLRSASITLWDSNSESLRLASSIGLTSFLNPDFIPADSFPTVRRVITSGTPLICAEKIGIVPSGFTRRRGENDGDFAVYPFNIENQSLGALTLSLEGGRFLDRHQLKAVEQMVDLISQNLRMSGFVQSLDWASKHDGLTGLYNHKTGLEMMEEAYRKNPSTLSCMMIDTDHFKRINDDNSHIVGDMLLRRIADILSANVPSGGFVFRYGGDEFTLVANLSKEDAFNLAEKIRKDIESSRLEISMGNRLIKKIGATATIAVATGSHESSDKLLLAADGLLVEVKRTTDIHGAEQRNLVVSI